MRAREIESAMCVLVAFNYPSESFLEMLTISSPEENTSLPAPCPLVLKLCFVCEVTPLCSGPSWDNANHSLHFSIHRIEIAITLNSMTT